MSWTFRLGLLALASVLLFVVRADFRADTELACLAAQQFSTSSAQLTLREHEAEKNWLQLIPVTLAVGLVAVVAGDWARSLTRGQ
jgi:uncharacterized MAPEG superfamily protein